jgi:hypothetical protein
VGALVYYFLPVFKRRQSFLTYGLTLVRVRLLEFGFSQYGQRFQVLHTNYQEVGFLAQAYEIQRFALEE